MQGVKINSKQLTICTLTKNSLAKKIYGQELKGDNVEKCEIKKWVAKDSAVIVLMIIKS